MKLPRDLDGRDLAKRLQRLGYAVTRQAGSHIRLTTHLNGEHHLTVPDHRPLRLGTMQGIFRDLEAHHRLGRGELLSLLFV